MAEAKLPRFLCKYIYELQALCAHGFANAD
jgi:hypothetical protein